MGLEQESNQHPPPSPPKGGPKVNTAMQRTRSPRPKHAPTIINNGQDGDEGGAGGGIAIWAPASPPLSPTIDIDDIGDHGMPPGGPLSGKARPTPGAATSAMRSRSQPRRGVPSSGSEAAAEADAAATAAIRSRSRSATRHGAQQETDEAERQHEALLRAIHLPSPACSTASRTPRRNLGDVLEGAVSSPASTVKYPSPAHSIASTIPYEAPSPDIPASSKASPHIPRLPIAQDEEEHAQEEGRAVKRERTR